MDYLCEYRTFSAPCGYCSHLTHCRNNGISLRWFSLHNTSSKERKL